MIFFVVLLHAGLVYESTGVAGFFWIVYDFSTHPFVDELILILDLFVMAVLFFISGYLTPMSLRRKRTALFVKSKIKRLMGPWLLGVVLLIPLYKMIFLYARDMPQQHWTRYLYFNNGIFSQSWLWFLPVLFIFNMIYLGLQRLNLKPCKLSLKYIAVVFFVLGLGNSMLMDLMHGQGWTKNGFVNFQNERVFIYFLLFLWGALCSEQHVFALPLKCRKPYIFLTATVWIPVVAYRFFHINSMMTPRVFVFSKTIDILLYWLAFHLALATLLTVLVNTYRIYWDRDWGVGKILNENSYAVYILHTVVLGAIALFLLDMKLTSLLKFLILTVMTYVVSNGIVCLLRQGIQWTMIHRRMKGGAV